MVLSLSYFWNNGVHSVRQKLTNLAMLIFSESAVCLRFCRPWSKQHNNPKTKFWKWADFLQDNAQIIDKISETKQVLEY